MGKPDRVCGLEVSEDPQFQEKSWKVQRVGWVAMLAVIAAALLGVFGSGPVSSATARAEGSAMTASYERFIRAGGEHEVELTLDRDGATADSLARVWVSSDWLDGNRVVGVSPAPSSETVMPDRVLFSFHVARAAEPVRIRLTLEARKAGVRTFLGGIEGQRPLSFRQVAYP